MTSIRYTFPLLLLCLLALAQKAHAQCTSDAGTLSNILGATCENDPLLVSHDGNWVNDGNDILLFVAYTGTAPNASTVFATSPDGNFAYQSSFLSNSPFKVAAVAGNNLSGSIDWDDPCLSVSNSLTVTYLPPPTIGISGNGILTCGNNVVTVAVTIDQQNCSFLWNDGNTTPVNVIQLPGTYCVTVTNQAGCTATDCVTIVQDADIPIVDAGPDTGIPCGGGNVTLTAVGQPASLTFSWSGPNNFNSILENPIVNEPGSYTVTVVNVANGCTATDQVTVFPGPAVPQQDFTVINADCQGGNNGSISFTMSLGQSPYEYLWTGPGGFSANTEDISGLMPGIYQLEVTDATLCVYYADVVVGQNGGFTIPNPIQVTNTLCNGGSDGAISFPIIGGIPPFSVSYSWNGNPSIVVITPFNQFSIINLPAGTYIFTVTDNNGCSVVTPPVQIIQPPLFTSVVNELSNTCEEVVLQVFLFGGTPPFTYSWSGPDGFISASQTVSIQVPGGYTVTVVDANGCSQIIFYDVQLTGGNCGYLSGHIRRDTSENCIAEVNETGLSGWLVRAESTTDTIYGVTASDGKYFIAVPLGDYTVTAIAPNNLWGLCPPGALVSVDVAGDTFPGGDIPVQKLYDCPALTVSIGTNQLRRCFSNNYYYVDYCNDGTATAEDAYILVTLDQFLSPVSATLPYTDLGNNILRFDVGDLDVGDCGSFSLQVQVSCDAVIGQTHCTEAHIYPDSTCLPADPQWSGASLKVSSECDGDSVRFTVKNIGTGDMTSVVDYIIIEDHVMLMGAPLSPLPAGDSVVISFPANGTTYRLFVEQEPFHPGNSQPTAVEEGCGAAGGTFSTGFVNFFPNGDADPWIDIDCTPNIGSYDPNDKQGFPVGYGATHYIRPGTELEYLIRFQNTGTDTAFTVRIVDTLSAWLDPATIRPGTSSHDYQFNLTGPGIVEFLYENILLPDSNVNEPASNGFVKFSILHRADAPLETVIENNAAIYFDFNEPVITNTTFHRLGENFLVSAWHPFVLGAEVKVSPNPFSEQAILEVKGLNSTAPLRLRVFDLQGIAVGEIETPSSIFTLQKNNWPAGVYLFSVFQEGRIVGSGKLMVK
jgi:uncharacterized repeat protein (TIGR01451 family)